MIKIFHLKFFCECNPLRNSLSNKEGVKESLILKNSLREFQ